MSRPKGSLNKDTSELHRICKKKNVHPFEKLCDMINLDWKALGHKSETRVVMSKSGPQEVPVISAEMQLKAIMEACQYLHSKRRSIEVEGTVETPGRPLKDLSDEELDKL